ncbi:Uncharacterised protein [uncultured archaeon]|nr:Uncharacterised protein [uncultured archaeon]
MVKSLIPYTKKKTTLIEGGNQYHGIVRVVINPRRESPEYYFETNKGRKIPISHYGKHRVISKNGGLVKLLD